MQLIKIVSRENPNSTDSVPLRRRSNCQQGFKTLT